MPRSIPAIIAFVILTGSAALAQEVEMSATASPSILPPGETFTYTVTVKGKGLSSLPSPKRPDLEGLEIVGESTSQTVSIVNLSMTIIRNVTYQIYVPPGIKEGERKIPGAELTHKGKTYSADPVTITIDKNAPPPTSPRTTRRRTFPFPGMDDGFFGGRRQSIEKDDLFVTMEVDKTETRVYEPVIATFKFYRSVKLWGQPSYERPDFKGFWMEELPYPGGVNEKNTRIRENGKSYILTSIRYALIPISPGKVEIEPARLVVKPDPMSGNISLATKPLTVDILPHPKEGPPDGYTGMVGQYVVTLETDPPPSKTSSGHSVLLRVNESVTLKVAISGEGYLNPIPPPARPLVNGFDVFDPKVTDSLDKSTGRLLSTRVIEIPMIAKEEGAKVIPPIEFSWFDQNKNEYVIKKTSPVTVAVAKASAIAALPRSGVKALTGDIRHIKPDKSSLDDWSTPAHRRWWFWLIVFTPFLAIPLAAFYARRRKALLADSAYVRSSEAYKRAIKIIKEAFATTGDSKLFYALIDQALRGYLGDIWDVPAPSVTKEMARQRLDGVEVGIRIEKMFDKIELGRYAPVDAEERSEIVREVEGILSEQEKRR